MTNRFRVLLSLILVMPLWVGCRTVPAGSPPPARTVEYTLKPDASWTLRPPAGRFDASGLVRHPDGRLLTINDKEPGVFEIRFGPESGFADLLPWTNLPPSRFQPLTPGRDLPWDLEGIALDSDRNVYLCEENSRWILRQKASGGPLERLPIDWSPVSNWFSTTDRNASFEGLAVGGGRIWVANERSVGRIIEIDSGTRIVVGSFRVAPPGVTAEDVHYTDLSWFDGQLWVLCRENRRVLQVDPGTHAVLASFSYFDTELDDRHAYRHLLPYGFFEGLSVDADSIWLLIDNNGFARKTDPKDTRPQLFRCPRPDRPQNRGR